MNFKLKNKNDVILHTKNKYCREDISIGIDDTEKNKIIPENIAEGQSILGVTGTFKGGVDTSDATNTADKVLKDEVGYANDERIVGTIETYDYSASEEVKPEIDKFITGELTEYYNDRVTTLAHYAMRPISEKVTKITLPNLLTFGASFYGCSVLEEVHLPLITEIAYQGFQNCTKLPTVDAPNATKIQSNAFYSCTSLEKLDFDKITYIANSAFINCKAFEKLILRNKEIVCQLSGTAPFFKDTLIASGTGFIYVPNELVEDYKSATNWSTLASQIKPLSELEVE